MMSMQNPHPREPEQEEFDDAFEQQQPQPQKAHSAVAWWDEPSAAPELDGLPEHVQRRLAEAGITTAQQVRDAGPDAILKIPMLGRKALNAIKAWLRSLDEPPQSGNGQN